MSAKPLVASSESIDHDKSTGEETNAPLAEMTSIRGDVTSTPLCRDMA